MKDLKSRLGIVHLLDPQDLAHTDTKSEILDTWGFNGACVSVLVGALTGVTGSNYLTPVLQESDTTADADFTDVDSADIHGAFTKMDATSEDQTTQTVGYAGTKRYIRVNLDFTGIGIVGRPRLLPAVAPSPVTAT